MDVAKLKESVNHGISKVHPGATPDLRRGQAGVLERVLFDTDNYRGFRNTDGHHGDMDDSLRFYF
jgi:hypothetical protein